MTVLGSSFPAGGNWQTAMLLQLQPFATFRVAESAPTFPRQGVATVSAFLTLGFFLADFEELTVNRTWINRMNKINPQRKHKIRSIHVWFVSPPSATGHILPPLHGKAG